MKTLEQYLRDAAAQGITEFSLTAGVGEDHAGFYIHPTDRDGETEDYVVHGNHATPLACDAPADTPSPIMRHFSYSHLPPHLAAVSTPICEVAKHADRTLPGCAEKSAGLRKLLEAKDCFVRAKLEEKR